MPDDFAGNSSTTGTFSVGGTVGGTIEILTDRDWFAVNLISGQTYTFALNSAATSGVADPYLTLYDSSSTYLTADDDGGTGLNSLLTYLAAYTGIYYLEASAYSDDYIGAYVLSSDTTAPVVQGFSPADEATSVAVGVNIVVTFNESVQRGFGTIYLKTVAGAIVEAFDAATSNRLSIFGSTLTIDPTANLANSTAYRVEFIDGNIRDLAGNNYAGTVSYNFTTQAPPVYTGTPGNDIYTGSAVNDTIYGLAGNDVLDGGAGNDLIDGGADADDLYGNTGNDTLSGAGGNDTLDGGDGNDTALYSGNFADYAILVDGASGDVIVTGEGTDRISDVEILRFADRDFEVLAGGAGADLLVASAGEHDDLIRGRDGNDTVGGGGGNDLLFGDEGEDSLDGGTGNDFLDGGTGNDSMTGGTGDDTYVVDSGGDVIVETNGVAALIKDPLADNPGGGVDTVISSINFTLGSFLENLQLVLNAGHLNGTGNSLANILTGNTQNNLLTGGVGDDTLEGSDGVDTAGFAGNRSAYALGPLGQATTSVSSGAEGTDTLSHVERVQFADGRVAIDSQGSAGFAAKVIGTLFGAGALGDRALVGQYLAQFDTGISLEEGMAAAIASARFVQLAGSHDNTAYVNLVYQNLAGGPPDAGTRDFLVGALNSGMTQAAMSVLAADYVAGMNAFPTGIAYELQESAAVTGTSGNDTLSGTAVGNVMFGREGNDVMTGLAGNDLISGGAGIDRAVYTGTTKAAATFTRNDVGMQVATASEGIDTLTQVERITYSNISVAWDISGNAGSVAKIIGAIFGPAALQDEALVGQYLAMLDAGMSYEEVTGAAAASARFGTEAGGHSNAQFVDRVYFNIAGVLPSADVAAPLVALLNSPGYSQAYLGSLAADVSYNVANVNLTGLAATGLEYTVS